MKRLLAFLFALWIAAPAFAAGSWNVSTVGLGGVAQFTWLSTDAGNAQPALDARNCAAVSFSILSANILTQGFVYSAVDPSDDPATAAATAQFSSVRQMANIWHTGPDQIWLTWPKRWLDIDLDHAGSGGSILVTCHASSAYPGDVSLVRAYTGNVAIGSHGIIRCLSGKAFLFNDGVASIQLVLFPVGTGSATLNATYLPTINAITGYPLRLPGNQVQLFATITGFATPGTLIVTCQ